MFRAYEALSEPIRKLITGMKAVHNGKHAYERRGYREGAEYPQAEHPIVRTPPVAGRQALFVNRIFTTRIVGLSKSKSVAILEMLYRHIETFDVQGAGGDIQSAGRQCGWV
jgi:taurine dioxygenase